MFIIIIIVIFIIGFIIQIKQIEPYTGGGSLVQLHAKGNQDIYLSDDTIKYVPWWHLDHYEMNQAGAKLITPILRYHNNHYWPHNYPYHVSNKIKKTTNYPTYGLLPYHWYRHKYLPHLLHNKSYFFRS